MMERQHIEMIVFKIDYFKQRQNYGKAEGKKSEWVERLRGVVQNGRKIKLARQGEETKEK